MAEIKPAEVSAILKKQLAGVDLGVELEEIGTVLTVGDGIARIYGLNNAQSGELVEFDDTQIVVNADAPVPAKGKGKAKGRNKGALGKPAMEAAQEAAKSAQNQLKWYENRGGSRGHMNSATHQKYQRIAEEAAENAKKAAGAYSKASKISKVLSLKLIFS